MPIGEHRCQSRLDIRMHSRFSIGIACDCDELGHDGYHFARIPTRVNGVNAFQVIEWSDDFEAAPREDSISISVKGLTDG